MCSFIEMETEIEALAERPSLLLLNEHCLLEIYDFLTIDNSINLTKACSRLIFIADRIYKKHSKFRLDSSMLNKGEKYIDCLFRHIGPHVTSLCFASYGANQNSCTILGKILGNISNNCKNLKHLECNYKSTLCNKDVQPAYSFDNVELLTLNNCNENFAEHFTKLFFESFHRLKSVIISRTYIGSNELKTIFQNNRSIESFVYILNRCNFDCELLQLIPNVERLCLIRSYCYATRIAKLNSLLKLNRFTKLCIDSRSYGDCLYEFENINSFPKELATRGIIEEIHFCEACDDYYLERLLNTLSSFSKLQLLVIESVRRIERKSSIAWPQQLKKLRLTLFDLTHNDLIVMVQQLNCIESIDIGSCQIVDEDINNFNYVTKLSHIIDHSNRKQRLDVILPDSEKPADPSKKYLIETERLRIWNRQPNKHNTLGIGVHFESYVSTNVR